MAKYVGKIFQVTNRKLGIKRNGAHYVDIVWFDPKMKTFLGKVITSLEEKCVIPREERQKLKNNIFIQSKDNKDLFRIFEKNKYYKVRNGEIDPIPADDMHGFDVWGGYENNVRLSKKDLDRSALQSDKYIARKNKKRK